jgi:hypothetical protein
MYAVAVISGERVFVVGGLAKTGDIANAETTVWSRPIAGTQAPWTTHAAIPGPRRSNFALAASGGKLYLFGGVMASGSGFANRDDAYEYDPQMDRWKALPRLPVARRAWFALEAAGRIWLYGGYTNTFETDIFEIDPATGVASRAGALPKGVADARFAVVGDAVISAGGESGPKIRAPWTILSKLKGALSRQRAAGPKLGVVHKGLRCNRVLNMPRAGGADQNNGEQRLPQHPCQCQTHLGDAGIGGCLFQASKRGETALVEVDVAMSWYHVKAAPGNADLSGASILAGQKTRS